KEEDFNVFDDKKVSYEFDPEKGVRIYDPYNHTSYKGYIDIDGWSAWSSEEDTFMEGIRDVLKDKIEETELSTEKRQEILEEYFKKKFKKE
ncbi:MAG: hypothetical protein DRG39_04020, partial [Deltaproteobacteria bacterium]